MSLYCCALGSKAMDEDTEKVQLRLGGMRMGEWGRWEVKGAGLGNISIMTGALLSKPQCGDGATRPCLDTKRC